ncbi:MAG: lipid-A-disaccharide synthase [Verrucomicrobia bacterium]|nr:lipid-A-disaccharide synthase [Verrucomicrobiota bacterium]
MSVERETPTFMMIAGEASGDTHAARLAEALRAQWPGVKLFGAGGPKMKAAGVEMLFDLTEHAVVGLTEVLAHYPKIRRLFWTLVGEAEQRRPDAVILTDYPGFNLRFAKQMKARGIPVFYFISPQVWAWAPWRARKFPKRMDLLMVIFRFEKEFYAQRLPALHVEFVGNPVVERLRQEPRVAQREPDLVALLPGSRRSEVERVLPVMAATARLLARERPGLRFEMAAATESVAALARSLAGDAPVTVRVGGAHELMQRAAAGMVAAGTATLESACFGLPHVIVYRFSLLTWLVFQFVKNINRVGIVNIVAGREVVPEFVQDRARPEALAAAVGALLSDAAQRERMQRELAEVVASLEADDVAGRAARAVLAKLAAMKS